MSTFTPTERTQVKRLPKRGMYDHETVFKILDEAFVCHVGFVVDGQPYVIPTNFGRVGETLYLHGSAASRMLRTLSEGIPVCVTATLIDGLVDASDVPGFVSPVESFNVKRWLNYRRQPSTVYGQSICSHPHFLSY